MPEAAMIQVNATKACDQAIKRNSHTISANVGLKAQNTKHVF